MKQRHRIFIAINFPDDIKKELSDFRIKYPNLPAKWTNSDNLHITLAFLGNIDNDELVEVCRAAKEIALKHNPFRVNLKRIVYGPAKKMPPRMVWVEGEENKELTLLKNDLENTILGSGKVNFSSENRAFSPHVTLARIKQWEFRRINPEEVPQIEEDIDLSFSVDSIEVMESVLKRSGPEYDILESYNLGNI